MQIADYKCPCASTFICMAHLGHHQSSVPSQHHVPEKVLLSVTDYELDLITQTSSAFRRSLGVNLLQAMEKKNQRVGLFMQKIKEIEEECTERLESMIKEEQTRECIFQEIQSKKIISLYSGRLIVRALAEIKLKEGISRVSIRKLTQDLADTLDYDEPSPAASESVSHSPRQRRHKGCRNDKLTEDTDSHQHILKPSC